MNPVLFLDRDGTINVDQMGGYVTRPENFVLIAGVAKALLIARRAGFKLAVITNQACVGKGIVTLSDIHAVHTQMEKLIAKELELSEFRFDDIQICPHKPDDKCTCRKPETDNLKSSMQKLSADPKRSFYVGDKDGDLLCATRCGLPVALVLTGHGAETLVEVNAGKLPKPSFIANDLAAAVAWAISQKERAH